MASIFKYCRSLFDNALHSRLPLQNLRSLDASRPKGLPGGFRTENDWKQEVRALWVGHRQQRAEHAV